jgi:pimeloyl-ACP methyl ester carboxylesterase
MDLWVEQRTTRTPDGRTLAIEQAGDPDGFPVLHHFGTPNSRHIFAPEASEAASLGMKLIGYDRPGYGGSTRSAGRTIADCAADVRAICAELGIGRLGMYGGSGGGPHVLACAALLPDLVTAAVSLASLAPYPAEGLDWFHGNGPDDGSDLKLVLTDRDAAWAALEKERAEMLAATPATILDLYRPYLSPPEAAALTGEVAEYFCYTNHDGLAPGVEGYFDDELAFMSPWGFELSDITVPVLLVHGRQDRMVPFSHGEWLATRIPGAETRFFDDEGHLSLLANRMDEVHAWLNAHR